MLTPGAHVCGKWTATSCNVVRLLGTGANGSVYLVQTATGPAALKVCSKAEDAAAEWGLLERVGRFSPRFPKPIAIDDDGDRSGVYFYLMESIPGRPLSATLPGLSCAVARSVLTQVLDGLSALHRAGCAYCDVKPENLLVAVTPQVSVRFVDVGGVTAFGRSVRQFTPFYDRGFWGLGSRQADPGYDLAAIALVWLCTLGSPPPVRLLEVSPAQRQDWLMKAVRKFPDAALRPWLLELVTGQTRDVGSALRILPPLHTTKPLHAYRVGAVAGGMAKAAAASAPITAAPPAVQTKRTRRVKHRHRRHHDWTEWLMWVSIGTAVFVTVIAWDSLLR